MRLSRTSKLTHIGIQRSKFLMSVAFAVALIIAGAPAYANVGLPMLIVVWPVMWVILVPIILLEAAVGTKLLHIGFPEAVQISALANIVSTLIGIPITWLILLVIEMRVGKGGGVYDISTVWGKIASVTIQSPWILPFPRLDIVVPAAALFLCIPFYLMSVMTECLSAQLITQGRLSSKELANWAWQANGVSYGLICLILLVLLFVALGKKVSKKSSDDLTPQWLERVYDSKLWQGFQNRVIRAAGIVLKYFSPNK